MYVHVTSRLSLAIRFWGQDMWSISGHLLWQEQWHKTNKWCHHAVHGIHAPCKSMSWAPFDHVHTFYFTQWWHLQLFTTWLADPSTQWTVSSLQHKHSSEDFFQFHAAAAYCMQKASHWLQLPSLCCYRLCMVHVLNISTLTRPHVLEQHQRC